MQYLKRNFKWLGKSQQNISPQRVWTSFFYNDVASASIKVPDQALCKCIWAALMNE